MWRIQKKQSSFGVAKRQIRMVRPVVRGRCGETLDSFALRITDAPEGEIVQVATSIIAEPSQFALVMLINFRTDQGVVFVGGRKHRLRRVPFPPERGVTFTVCGKSPRC